MKRLIDVVVLATATVITAATQITFAQPSTPTTGDPRVKAALEKEGLKYEVDQDGDFRVGMRFSDGRTQIVLIRSATEQVGGMEIRELLSPAYKVKGKLSADVANKLLADSANKKLGAWQVFSNQEYSIAVFSSRIPAGSNPDDLIATLQVTLRSADSMEKALSGKDDF